jgi:hypothetical protein
VAVKKSAGRAAVFRKERAGEKGSLQQAGSMVEFRHCPPGKKA